jgi:hypothetical protein
MSDRLDAVFTPTSCKWAKQCAVPAKKARREALEEAAKVCDESEAYALADYEIAMRRGEKEDAVRFSVQQRVARAMAAAIRAAKEGT